MQHHPEERDKATLFNHMQAFRALSRSPAVLCGDLYHAMEDIVHTLTQALPHARVGIWTIDDTQTERWQCLASNEPAQPFFKSTELQDLINILDREFIYTVDNTVTLPKRSLAPLPFFERPICAQLCAGIQIDAQTKGIVCCEFEHTAHRWSIDEMYFTESIANFTSLFLSDYNRRRAEMKLFDAMRNDRLTGLANASHFIQTLKSKIQQRGETPLLLALLDIRGFRHINDIHGHDFGDEILKKMAIELTRRLPDALIGRTASNEFIIARHIDDIEVLAQTNHELTRLLHSDLQIRDEHITLESSIGTALYPNNATRIKSLIRKCDIALFKAKETSRAGFIAYNTQLGYDYVQHIHLKKRLKTAIRDKTFVNYYQPKINLATRAVTSGEVLIRWRDKHGKFVSPADFIPIAERTGMINDVGHLVHDNICNDLNLIRDFNRCNHVLAINASVHELRDPNYVDHLLDCTQACDLPPNQFEIEVTESTFLDEDYITHNNLKRLQKQGFSLALDDFGTGYSSLSYLKQIQFDTIKIDRSFVQNIHQCRKNREITTSLIKLFHTMGCKVVAEGVEDIAEAHVLRDLDCDFAQGFLYAKPMGINRYTQYLDCSPQHPTPFVYEI